MHGIGTIGAHSLASPSQGAGANSLSSQSGSGFQLTSLTGASNPSVARGISSTASPSLGSQSISTLLQTQDLSQTQVRGGGGHGGGAHHGTKMTLSPEAEEAVESEEAQTLRQSKKSQKTGKSATASEPAKVDENGEVVDDVEQTGENKRQNNEGGLSS